MNVYTLRGDLLERRQALHVEKMRLELLMRELERIDAALDALPEDQISQLELLRKAREEGGSNEQEASTENGGASARKRPTRLTNEQVRDWILDEVGARDFTTPELQLRFGVSRGTAQNRIRDLERMQIIVAVNRRQGRWSYNGEIKAGPTTRPRGERLLDVPSRRKAGTPVPGTGVPAGPAETPGKLKRQQRAAKRVLHKPVKGVRL